MWTVRTTNHNKYTNTWDKSGIGKRRAGCAVSESVISVSVRLQPSVFMSISSQLHILVWSSAMLPHSRFKLQFSTYHAMPSALVNCKNYNLIVIYVLKCQNGNNNFLSWVYGPHQTLRGLQVRRLRHCVSALCSATIEFSSFLSICPVQHSLWPPAKSVQLQAVHFTLA